MYGCINTDAFFFQASNIIEANADDEAAGDAAPDARSAGGLADLAESVADAVENATTEIFNATQVNNEQHF